MSDPHMLKKMSKLLEEINKELDVLKKQLEQRKSTNAGCRAAMVQEEELKELRKDKARIDWVVGNHREIGIIETHIHYNTAMFNSFRDAIDAAMEKQQ